MQIGRILDVFGRQSLTVHHSIILLSVLLILRSRIASIATCQLQVGRRIDADSGTVRNDTLMVNLPLVHALITTAAHVGNLARR